MTKKLFTYARVRPAPWVMTANVDDAPITFMEPAPEGINRNFLRTTITPHEESPNGAFGLWEVDHDVVGRVAAYDETDENGEDPDEVRERAFVRRQSFYLYEFFSGPGMLYGATSETALRRVFRRYKNSTSSTYELRAVRLNDLEEVLKRDWVGTSIAGYKLIGVAMTTLVRTLTMAGDDLENNVEAQDAKEKARDTAAITFRLQHGEQMISVQVSNTGAVTFQDYPGDEAALGFLEQLEQYVQGCSNHELVRIR